MTKVKIELSPYDALGIYSFLKEFFTDELNTGPEFTAIRETVDAYELAGVQIKNFSRSPWN